MINIYIVLHARLPQGGNPVAKKKEPQNKIYFVVLCCLDCLLLLLCYLSSSLLLLCLVSIEGKVFLEKANCSLKIVYDALLLMQFDVMFL